MAIYFIDGDNCPGTRTEGIKYLTENDQVYVFYAQSNSFYSKDNNRGALVDATDAKVEFCKIKDGKNAVDFSVAVKAGFFAAQNIESIFLVSCDKHFEYIADLINAQLGKKNDVKRVNYLSDAFLYEPDKIANIETAELILKNALGKNEGSNLLNRIQELNSFKTEYSYKENRRAQGLIQRIFH